MAKRSTKTRARVSTRKGSRTTARGKSKSRTTPTRRTARAAKPVSTPVFETPNEVQGEGPENYGGIGSPFTD